MSYVYRRPFQTAQHRVARVEWQPQPLWAFDGVAEYWELTEYAGTIGYYSGAAATFNGIADSLILTENTGSIGFQVPDVVPMSESGARYIIQQVGGFVVTVTTSSSPYIAFGDVISTYPVGGTYAPYGSTVMLVVSIGTQAPGEHGAGYPVGWQGKRKKLTLKQQPNKHLRKLLDSTGREVLKTKPKKPKFKVKAIKLWS
jgi:hypothetical protein